VTNFDENEIIGGGAIPQNIKMSIVYGMRLILFHLKLQKEENPDTPDAVIYDSMTHDQLGIGTGEDLVPYCYFWERLRNGYHSLTEMLPEVDPIEDRLHDINNTGLLSEAQAPPLNSVVPTAIASGPIYLNGWDFDDAALTGCRSILSFASQRCRIANKDLFRLEEPCQSVTLTSTGTGGPLFFIQTLLYVLGARKTKYFIFDNPGNRQVLFDLIKQVAIRLGYKTGAVKAVERAAKTSMVDTEREDNVKYIEDAFHGPFMASLIEASDANSDVTAINTNRRDLSYMDVAKFVKWTFKYLPPPPNVTGTVASIAGFDEYQHCEVSYNVAVKALLLYRF